MTEVSPHASESGAIDTSSDTMDALQPPREQASTGDGIDESREGGESSATEHKEEAEETEEEDDEDDDSEDEDDDEDDDDEPKLKYARLTSHLGAVYRNGDATSTFLVAGDKMVRPRISMALRPLLTCDP